MNATRHTSSGARRRAAPARRHSSRAVLWWAGVVALPFVTALSPYTAMVVVVGLAPAIVAWITSTPAQRNCAVCIGYMSLAGVLPVAWSLLQAGPSATAAGQYLSNPFVWLAMYSPAAVGWLVYLTVPPLHEMLFMQRLQRRRRWLERRQKRLVAEWGPQTDPAYNDRQPESVARGAVS